MHLWINTALKNNRAKPFIHNLFFHFFAIPNRRDARAVEWGGLENRCTGNCTQGRDEPPVVAVPTEASAFESHTTPNLPAMDTHFTYILFSEKFDKYYIGHTKDVQKRLGQHNAGFEKSTKPYMPWRLECFVAKETKAEAMCLENKLKNLNRKRLIAFMDKYCPKKQQG